MSAESFHRFSAIAYQCLKRDRKRRPTIVKVVGKLAEVLGLQQKYEEALALQQVADNLKDRREGEDDCKVKNMDHMKIPLEDIKEATHNFHKDYIIGFGGFGKVYKAKLFHFDFRKYIKEGGYGTVSMVELSDYRRTQSLVAIKRLDRKYGQGTPEFLQEISVLPYFTHKNLVTLVGFCDEDHERILVYEYASNGSFDSHIQSDDIRSYQTWATSLQICLDAAHGLNFLHNGVGERYRIIHRDIKSSNILLGRNYIGMISDFGLSRIGPANLQATFLMTQVAGTLEYIDPQYHKTALSGRLARFPRSKDDPEYLPDLAKRCFEQKHVTEIIDPKFKKQFEKASSPILDEETCPDTFQIFASIAYKCCNEKREDRPAMAEVVEELQKAIKSHVKGVEALRTTLDDIRFATNNFRGLKEQGPLGEVYRGEISHSRGDNTVTIKRLHRSIDSYGEEFVKKIARLYGYSHKNVVPVLGFCEEQGERVVVFEHMVKGSVKEHLTNNNLTWKNRLKICLDAAHGIAHIHSHVETEPLIHGDIKSSVILLRDDWTAAISNFIIFKGVGTLGYAPSTGSLSQKSDVYSFGVVLFEILSGRLAIERIKTDQQNSARGTGEEERVVFLAQLAAKCFKNQKIEDIIFHAIKEQTEPQSLVIFSTIAYQCLLEQPEDRPTMAKVVEELEKAFNCQDEWDWEQKLPTDYEEIIQMSKCPVSSTITKKDLYSLLSSGIILDKRKVLHKKDLTSKSASFHTMAIKWFSISKDGARNEMVSAKSLSYKDISCVKWRSTKNSRFGKVAEIFDSSDLNIRIQIRTHFLTPGMMYGAYLVFKFSERRKVSSRPLYVNLKYKMAGETLNAYFAEWKEGGSLWLRVELFRFLSNEECTDFEALLESFSPYYCGKGVILVEGIEFHAIPSADLKEDKGVKDGTTQVGVGQESGEELVISDYSEVIKRSGNNVENASKKELCFLLANGILIDNGEKFFSLSKVNLKKCHMLRAKETIYSPSNVKFIKPPTGSRCKFGEVVEILSHQDFHIKCDIETKLLSSDTTYACYLVVKLSKICQGLKCPVKARDLLPYKKERTKIISFTSPSTVNLDKIKWIPEHREDGWMEVKVWETIFDDNTNKDEYAPMDLKLTCFEGNMCGLIVYGIEFRPIA